MKPLYLSLNRFLKERFGKRVQKIPLDAGLGCPNREPLTKKGGCIYCNFKGSGTGASFKGLSIKEQMESGIKWAKRRYKAKAFMPYFQSYSNTYGDIEHLKSLYSQCLEFPGVVGVSIGTRPDCVTHEVLELISDIFKDKMVWMEYGLQSASDKTLSYIKRGHTVKDFEDAVKLTRKFPFLICVHVIFGLPGEGEKEMMKTIEFLRDIGVDGIKFHELYVVRDTPLHKFYKKGEYRPIDQRKYARLVARAISLLPEETVIQRLTGDPLREELIAPNWARDKQATIKMIKDYLKIIKTS